MTREQILMAHFEGMVALRKRWNNFDADEKRKAMLKIENSCREVVNDLEQEQEFKNGFEPSMVDEDEEEEEDIEDEVIVKPKRASRRKRAVTEGELEE